MPATEPARRSTARIAVAVASVLVLGGCASSGTSNAPVSGSGLGPAERVSALLGGRYAGGVRGEEDAALVRVEAAVERVAAEGVFVRLDQVRADEAARSFRLVLEPTRVPTRLEGRFSPLNDDGSAIGACPLTVVVRSTGFVASTDAATCRFGSGARARALIKEIAHDGERLVIADRIVDAESGEAVGEDRVLELHRVRRFRGWSGVRDGEPGPWRISRPLEIDSDGAVHTPVDAAGVPLGFSLELAPHRVRPEEPPVLRLRVFDDDSGALLVQAWGDAAAERVGVALPGLQIGLRAVDP